MGKAFLYGNQSGGKKPMIIVTAPTGSTVTCSMGDKVKNATEKDGQWVFKNCGVGTWTVTATLGINTNSKDVTIPEEGQLMEYRITIAYQLYPDDFDLEAYGIKGKDYEVVQDDDTVIAVADYRKFKNWKIRLLTSGTLVILKDGNIDVFAVGAGAGTQKSSSQYYRSQGGDTIVSKAMTVIAGTSYAIEIGAGGLAGSEASSGGTTSAFGIIAEGSVHTRYELAPYDPGDPEFLEKGFGAKLYGGNYEGDVNGEDNTGFGGSGQNKTGGSGIVVICNERNEVA